MLNTFTRYKQQENHLTNALFSILSLSQIDASGFAPSFLEHHIRDRIFGDIQSFHVLRDFPGTADAELCGEDLCIRVETKIVSGTIRADQIQDHLKYLEQQPQSRKWLLLITPDDTTSRYVKDFVAPHPDVIRHISWKDVYDRIDKFVRESPQSVLTELFAHFRAQIHDMVFRQDFAGVIVKIAFGKKSGVNASNYLQQLKDKQWMEWNTPREYKNLDGTGRKLMLYDRTRNAITAELQIQSVKQTNEEPDYPWTNKFAPDSLKIFDPPISLDQIRTVQGLENFGLYRKDRSPYRNVTHQQYRMLTSHVDALCSSADFLPCR